MRYAPQVNIVGGQIEMTPTPEFDPHKPLSSRSRAANEFDQVSGTANGLHTNSNTSIVGMPEAKVSGADNKYATPTVSRQSFEPKVTQLGLFEDGGHQDRRQYGLVHENRHLSLPMRQTVVAGKPFEILPLTDSSTDGGLGVSASSGETERDSSARSPIRVKLLWIAAFAFIVTGAVLYVRWRGLG